MTTASYNLSQLGSHYNQGDTSAVDRTTASKLQESVSIKDFGAVGDGVTDDTAAFTAAYNATNANGRALYLPHGVYKITSPIPCGGEMFGNSRRYHGATILPVGCSVFDTSSNNTTTFTPVNRTKFRNIRIDCSSIGTTAPAFKLWYSYSLELDGIFFDSFSGSQTLITVKQCFDVLINKCVIAAQSGTIGVYLEDAAVTMTNNDIEGWSSGIYTAGGTHGGGTGNTNVLVTIFGGYFEGNANHINCAHGAQASVSIISPNIRIVNGQNGVRIAAPNVSVFCPNVEIDGTGGYAINVDAVKLQGGSFYNVNLIGCDETKIYDIWNFATHSPSGNGFGSASGVNSIRRNQMTKQLTLSDNVATTSISFYVPNASWIQGTLKLNLYKQSTGYTEYREYNVTINGTSGGASNYDFSLNKSVTLNNSQASVLTISGTNTVSDFIVTVTCDLAGIFQGTTIPLIMTFDYQCTGPVAVY